MFFAAALLSLTVHAYNPDEVAVTGHQKPRELESVNVTENLGAQLDLALQFTADDGRQVHLGEFFHKDRPVLMAMVYYNCPSLCSLHLNGLNDVLRGLKWTSGKEFDVVAVSMDHTEGTALASAKKQAYLKDYGRDPEGKGWHFLTGNQENVKKLADQLGFKFNWLEDKKEFAHAAVAYVITPSGKISRYLHGVAPDPGTVRMSMLEASNGSIGSYVEQVMMFCFVFDPKKNKYTLYAWNMMRIGAVMMVLLLAIFLLPVWWREQRR